MDSINDIISNLTEEDIEDLKGMAAEIFGSEKENEPPPEKDMPDLSDLLGSAEMIGKITGIMNAMRKEDDRVKFIGALKPLLSRGRRKRADDAIQLLKIIDIIPLISSLKDK